jgi:hypothetical protein
VRLVVRREHRLSRAYAGSGWACALGPARLPAMMAALSTNELLLGIGLVLVLAFGEQLVAKLMRPPAIVVLLPARFVAGILTDDVGPSNLLWALHLRHRLHDLQGLLGVRVINEQNPRTGIAGAPSVPSPRWDESRASKTTSQRSRVASGLAGQFIPIGRCF